MHSRWKVLAYSITSNRKKVATIIIIQFADVIIWNTVFSSLFFTGFPVNNNNSNNLIQIKYPHCVYSLFLLFSLFVFISFTVLVHSCWKILRIFKKRLKRWNAREQRWMAQLVLQTLCLFDTILNENFCLFRFVCISRAIVFVSFNLKNNWALNKGRKKKYTEK